MEMQVFTAEGIALDWMVAKAMGATNLHYDTIATYWFTLNGKDHALSSGWSPSQNFAPSTNWVYGGPIIEKERLCIDIDSAGVWLSYTKQSYDDESRFTNSGSTALIAAMRCFVVSKLGEKVDVPSALR